MGANASCGSHLPHPASPAARQFVHADVQIKWEGILHYNRRLPIKLDARGAIDLQALEDSKRALRAIPPGDLKCYGQFGLTAQDISNTIGLLNKLIEWRDQTGIFAPPRSMLDLPTRADQKAKELDDWKRSRPTIGAAPRDTRTEAQRDRDLKEFSRKAQEEEELDEQLRKLHEEAAETSAIPFERLGLMVGYSFGGQDKRLIVGIAKTVIAVSSVAGVFGAAKASNISADRTTGEINFEELNERLDEFFEWSRNRERDYQKASNSIGIERTAKDFVQKQHARIKSLMRSRGRK